MPRPTRDENAGATTVAERWRETAEAPTVFVPPVGEAVEATTAPATLPGDVSMSPISTEEVIVNVVPLPESEQVRPPASSSTGENIDDSFVQVELPP